MTQNKTNTLAFLTLIQPKNYRSILCLDGELPDLSFFDCALPIIAADGAANKLVQMSIHPNLIIGDLDTVTTAIRNTHPVLHVPDQDTNDFQKALHYLQTNNLLPTIILGINGGYLDHILNNVNIFLETNNVFYAPPLIGYVLNAPQQISFTLPLNTKISLLGIPSATVTSSGLKWELQQYSLSFPGTTSCFNRTITPTITIETHIGKTLILIYEQPTQDAGVADK